MGSNVEGFQCRGSSTLRGSSVEGVPHLGVPV